MPPSSPAENVCFVHASNWQTLACSTATPLGNPVEPEV